MKKENKELVKSFCQANNITEDQFFGKTKIESSLYLRSLTSIPEGFNPTVGGSLYLSSLTSIPEGFNPTVGGYLDLSSLTSIPEGFNPTVGGSLDLSSLTSIPEGFNPTVGGSLYLRSLTSIPEGFNPTVGGSLDLSSGSRHIGKQVKPVSVKTNFFWKKDRVTYALIDGIFCQILSKKESKGIIIFSAKYIGKQKTFFIAHGKKMYAHGETVKQAVSDLQFKILSEKLKKDPIKKDTIITMQYYRLITGACELGIKAWMEQNEIKKEKIKAADLLPILEKTNAYGLEKFKKLVTF